MTIIPHVQEPLPRTYIYGTDYMPITRRYADAGESEGQVVWLSECRRSDYDWQDVVGKIVLCRNDVRNVEVYRQAMAHRAGGVLMVDLEDEGHPFQRSVYRQPPLVAETIPAFRISRSVAEDLLAGSGYTLENLSLRFQAVPLSTTVRISIDVEEEEIEARNVLGLLPGSDLEVGAKVIVIGAHYDHVGSDLGEAIIRGANDNASGTAVLLEIALLWQEQGRRPARSVLFAVEEMRAEGEKVGMLRLKTLWPFPDRLVKEVGARAKKILVPEMNMGQVVGEVMKYASAEVVLYSQTNGEVIHPAAIKEQLRRLV